MSTEKQVAANQANAQHSSGPKSEEGKASSCLNNFRWGFCGAFTVLPAEDQEEYDGLLLGLRAEYQPATLTETIFVEKMAQHHWLGQRALRLQDITMADDLPLRDKERQFSLFLRYQTTNDRAFHKCLSGLLKLRAEKRRTEIGFESQKQKQEQEARKQAVEKRKQDLHKLNVLLAEAKADHQMFLNYNLEFANQRAVAAEKAA